jgi:hypothetical protein
VFGVCIVFLAALAGPRRCAADRFPVPAIAADSLPDNVVAHIRTHAQINADDMFDFLLLTIDELDRVSRLSPQQQAKLRIAAKGAVERALAKWTETTVEAAKQSKANAAALANQPVAVMQAHRMAGANAPIFLVGREHGGQRGGGLVIDQPANGQLIVNGAGAIDFAQDRDIIQLNPGFIVHVDLTAIVQPLDRKAAAREALWTAAEKSVLSPEQWRLRRFAEADREALPRNTPVEQVLAELDRQLLIDPAQRPQFSKVMRDLINTRLRLSSNGDVYAPSVAASMLSSNPSAAMTKILSERQISYWKASTKTVETKQGGVPDRLEIRDLIYLR